MLVFVVLLLLLWTLQRPDNRIKGPGNAEAPLTELDDHATVVSVPTTTETQHLVVVVTAADPTGAQLNFALTLAEAILGARRVPIAPVAEGNQEGSKKSTASFSLLVPRVCDRLVLVAEADGYERNRVSVGLSGAERQSVTIELHRAPDLLVEVPTMQSAVDVVVTVRGHLGAPEQSRGYLREFRGIDFPIPVCLPLGSTWDFVQATDTHTGETLGVHANPFAADRAPITPARRLQIGASETDLRIVIPDTAWGPAHSLELTLKVRSDDTWFVLYQAAPGNDGWFIARGLNIVGLETRVELRSADGIRLVSHTLSPEDVKGGTIEMRLEEPGRVRISLSMSPTLLDAIVGTRIAVAIDGQSRLIKSGARRSRDGRIEVIESVGKWTGHEGSVTPARLVELDMYGSVLVDRIPPGNRHLKLMLPAANVVYSSSLHVLAGQTTEWKVVVRGAESGGVELVARESGSGDRILGARWWVDSDEIAAPKGQAMCRLAGGETLVCVARGYETRRIRVPPAPPAVLEVQLEAKSP